MPRLCPRDDTPLHEQRAGRVNVDVCPKCHGTFLDGIELKRVLGDNHLALALADARGDTPSPIDCPACGSAMFLDRVGDVETAARAAREDQDGSAGRHSGPVEIDHCRECLGVWLDAGEVERLAARALALAARAAKVHLEETLTDVATELRGGT